MRHRYFPLFLFLAFVTVGCASNPALPGGGWFHWPGHSVPKPLEPTGHFLDFIIAASILVVGGGLGLFFFVPSLHKIIGTALAVGGGVLATALILKTTLWLIPWIAGGLVLLALGVLILELVLKYKGKQFLPPKQKLPKNASV